MLDAIRHQLTQFGVYTAHPAAFAIATLYVVLWIALSPQTFEWHSAVTVATLFMTLFIQRAEHRDTQAIHAKLDELLHANKLARNSLQKVDQEEPEDIERMRKVDQARN
jgi:low affinity Fe/Cu permease